MKTTREQCPRCAENGRDRSRDNLARYSDGKGYCFSCGYLDRPYKKITVNQKQPATYKGKLALVPRNSLGHDWLRQYGITDKEKDTYFSWNDLKQHLVYTKSLPDGTEYVSTRNFFPGLPKSLSYGNKPYSVLKNHPGKPIVLVEDLVSAIKVSRHYNAVPLFGTTCPKEALESLLNVSKHVYIWLDKDALEKSLKIRSEAFKHGFIIASLVRTELDPKNYSDDEIINILSQLG